MLQIVWGKNRYERSHSFLLRMEVATFWDIWEIAVKTQLNPGQAFCLQLGFEFQLQIRVFNLTFHLVQNDGCLPVLWWANSQSYLSKFSGPSEVPGKKLQVVKIHSLSLWESNILFDWSDAQAASGMVLWSLYQLANDRIWNLVHQPPWFSWNTVRIVQNLFFYSASLSPVQADSRRNAGDQLTTLDLGGSHWESNILSDWSDAQAASRLLMVL